MEQYIALTLANQGVSKFDKNIYKKENVEWICKAIAEGNVDKTLEMAPLDSEKNAALIEFFKEMPLHYFIMKLRRNLFCGNFEYAKIRMDFKVCTRICPKVNEVMFVMEIGTAEGKRTVRLSPAMIDKLVSELTSASRVMQQSIQAPMAIDADS